MAALVATRAVNFMCESLAKLRGVKAMNKAAESVLPFDDSNVLTNSFEKAIPTELLVSYSSFGPNRPDNERKEPYAFTFAA